MMHGDAPSTIAFPDQPKSLTKIMDLYTKLDLSFYSSYAHYNSSPVS